MAQMVPPICHPCELLLNISETYKPFSENAQAPQQKVETGKQGSRELGDNNQTLEMYSSLSWNK